MDKIQDRTKQKQATGTKTEGSRKRKGTNEVETKLAPVQSDVLRACPVNTIAIPVKT